MDGIHDLGGKQGYGPVDTSGADEVFHDRWEAKVFAMVNAAAAAGAFNNTDRFRHAIERINPVAYLSHGYYGRWLGGIETLLVEAGLITRDEVTARALQKGASASDLIASQPEADPDPMGPPPTAAASDRPLTTEPRFQVGDEVITSNHSVSGHTRLPAYARGKVGKVVLYHQGWVFPDTNAHGQGEQPQHLYTVSFSSETLWGTSGFSVALDLFEPYLERNDV